MLYIIVLISNLFTPPHTTLSNDIQGAWQSENGVLIISGNYFSYSDYNSEAFHYTYGGSFQEAKNSIDLTYEFHSNDSEKVGTNESKSAKIKGKKLLLNDVEFSRMDDGSPGELKGAWLFSSRERDGEMSSPRSPDESRKTMKILSGTRFQWIAYDTESKEFMGTGGGTYTTIDSKYTENIDFFSRDQTRVGASLEFEFERKDDAWDHKGFSSKGDPMYEIWRLRE